MTIQSVLSVQEQAEAVRIAQEHNAKVNNGRLPQQQLGKDDFLKLLVTQLSYQDPTAPMNDKEFVAQMAQFSTLDQMTSMANDFARLKEMLSSGEATSSLGKSVELIDNDTVVQGTVLAVTRGANPQILVNGEYYNWEQVTKIIGGTETAEKGEESL
ncbi:MAG: flagellar hook assembly protein FlgD [Treponema sp.]|jgi:flagellar basal-body rod modification protein FlgD|nr:flagellar hook assembly protein FlgD [Treponema sp.]